MMMHESFCYEDTIEIAKKIGSEACAGEIYCLNGDLGAGKTVFAKGFAQGLCVDDYITSPTFTIINEYMGRLPFYHFDVYRLENSKAMEDLGYLEYFFGDGVCLIEWAQIIQDIIPEDVVCITIQTEIEKGENYRKIEINKITKGDATNGCSSN